MRFSGFEGEWEKKKLEQVAVKVNSGKTPLGGEKAYSNEGIIFIRSQNINNDRLELDSPVFISEEVNKGMKNSVVQSNDILLNITGASLGRSCVVPDNFIIGNVNQHVCIIRLNENYNPRFIQPYFSSQNGQNIFLSLQTGSGREGLNFESIKSIQLFFPNKEEQKMIAYFLSIIDSRIQTQSKIIQRLESLMQGVRENVFKQQKRFKNKKGNDLPEWEAKKLDLILIKNSNKNKGQKHSLVQSVSNKYGFINQDEMFEDRQVASKNTSNYYVIEKGHFAYNPSRINVGSLAYKFDNKTSVISPLYISFRANNNYIKDDYLLNWFSTQQFLKQMDKSFEGSVRNTLSYESLVKMKISIPSLDEQEKIVNILSSINKKIQTEKSVLEQLEIQKKYLLQNLFI